VIGENELAEPIRTLWDKIGRQNTFPKEWRMQKTAWIPKQGNKKNEVHKRRGITILDGGAKGYLVWLKKKMGNIKFKNSSFFFSASSSKMFIPFSHITIG
jgi:hypothetical protein